MAVTGDWVTPWFEPGVPFWGKPPLAFWAPALSIKLLGLSEFSLRLPAFAAMLGMLALVHAFAARQFGASAARWAALVFATMLLPLASAGAVLTDPFLALGVTLSMTSFLLARRDGPVVALWLSWAWRSACCPGPLALVLVAAAVLPWSLLPAGRAQWRALPWIGGTILMLALALPWYVMAEIRTPGFLQYFIVGEHFLRFVDPGWQGDLYGTAHKRPYGGIWLDWLLATMPWGLAGLWLFLRPGQDAPLRTRLASLGDPLRAYLLLWGLAAPAFFTLSGNILWTMCCLRPPRWRWRWAPGWRTTRRRGLARLPAALMLLTPLAALTLGALSLAQPERYKTEKQLVAQAFARMQPGEQLVFVGSRPFSARFYSQGAAGQPMEAGVAAAPALPGAGARLPGGRKEPPAAALRDTLAGWRLLPLYASRRYVLLQVESGAEVAPLRTGRPPSQRPALWAVRRLRRPEARSAPARHAHQAQDLEHDLRAGVRAVLAVASQAGATSTRSPPAMFRPASPRSMAWASRTVTPPTSGVPVPGAGGIQTVDVERHIDRRVAHHLARLGHDGVHAQPGNVLGMDHGHARGVGELPQVLGRAAMPIWMVRVGSSTPSSTAWRKGPP